MVSHDIELHTECKRTLDNLDYEIQERITDGLTEIAERRKPMSHPKVGDMDSYPLLKLRVGTWRVLFERVQRTLRVVLIDKRCRIYDRLEVATQRTQG